MAHAFLVTPSEIPLYGIGEEFLKQFTAEILDANCQAVTDEVLGRMAPAVVPPLLAWGSDIKANCARILAYELKSIIGLAPTNVAVGDENLLIRAQQARAWFDAVGAGEIDPQDLIDSSTSTDEGGFAPAVTSDARLGW